MDTKPIILPTAEQIALAAKEWMKVSGAPRYIIEISQLEGLGLMYPFEQAENQMVVRLPPVPQMEGKTLCFFETHFMPKMTTDLEIGMWEFEHQGITFVILND